MKKTAIKKKGCPIEHPFFFMAVLKRIIRITCPLLQRHHERHE